MSIDEIAMIDLEFRNIALNEILDRTILGLPTDPTELRKTLKLHYLRRVLEANDVPQHEWHKHLDMLVKEQPEGTKDLDPAVAEWVTNSMYHPRNLVAIVTRDLSASAGHSESLHDNPEHFDRMARAILELHPKQISGLTTGFTVSSEDDSKATFTVSEKYGRPVDNFLTWWYREQGLSVDVIFFEPDPTHTVIVKAWKGTNLRPTWYSGIASYRTMAERSSSKGTDLLFTLDGDWAHNDTVNAEAQVLLNGLTVAAANPYARNEFVGKISDDVLNFVIDRP